MRRFTSRLGAYLALGLLLTSGTVWGQSPTKKSNTANPSQSSTSADKTAAKRAVAKTTIVEFELLQPPDATGLFAQHWLKVLEPLDVKLRIHRPSRGEKPEIKEREAGNLRYVTAVGNLDRSGGISFPDRTYNVGDTVKLKEWIQELRTYGALGIPTGQPIWGLTKEQFDTLFEAVIKPVDFETEEIPLPDVIAKLPLPTKSPLQWSAEAKSRLEHRGTRTKVRQELKGFTVATALAIMLSEFDMGFRPNRLPSGQIELWVEPRKSSIEQWSVGWPLQVQKIKSAPKFFEMVPIGELSDVELSDLLVAAAKITETPIFIDYGELESKGIELDKIKVSFPLKVTNWSIALSRMIVPQKLSHEIWQDEVGHAFVWITTNRAARAKGQDKNRQQP